MRVRTIAAVVSICSLLLFGQSAIAQDNCKAVKAKLTEVHPGGIYTRGVSTNAGILRGTTFRQFDIGNIETLVPTTLSVASHWTLTTRQGKLKTRNVYLYDLLTGLWAALGHVDPIGSTGRFAGATGVLYFNGRTASPYPSDPNPPWTYLSDVAGEICFASVEDD